MVSSLPFLAPVFIRKAKAYRSNKNSGSDGMTPRMGRSGDRYKLSSLNRDRSGFASATAVESGSEENILKEHGMIVKSVTVQVDEEQNHGQRLSGPRAF